MKAFNTMSNIYLQQYAIAEICNELIGDNANPIIVQDMFIRAEGTIPPR